MVLWLVARKRTSCAIICAQARPRCLLNPAPPQQPLPLTGAFLTTATRLCHQGRQPPEPASRGRLPRGPQTRQSPLRPAPCCPRYPSPKRTNHRSAKATFRLLGARATRSFPVSREPKWPPALSEWHCAFADFLRAREAGNARIRSRSTRANDRVPRSLLNVGFTLTADQVQ